MPGAPRAHLFVALGAALLEPATVLGAGDAARLSDAGERTMTAGPDGAEVLLWVTPAALA